MAKTEQSPGARLQDRETEIHYFDERQLNQAWAVPAESDELPRYGGHATVQRARPGEGMADGLSHVVLPVTDLDRSEEYYCDFFGLDLVGRNLTAEERPHSVLQMNTGQLIILVQHEKVVPERPGHAGTHSAFTATPSQYRRLIERARARGMELGAWRAQFFPQGEYQINPEDPDGNRLEVDCTSPEAWEPILPNAGVVDCGLAERYRVGDVKLFRAYDFYVVRLPEGFLAPSRWCQHMNGKVVWEKERGGFRCPYHRACYDRRGNCVGGQPNLNALRLHPLSVTENGRVLVNTNELIDRPGYDPTQAVTLGSGPGTIAAPDRVTPAAPQKAPSDPSAIDTDLLAGVVLEVTDLHAARAFYEPIFRDAEGVWESTVKSLRFRTRRQTIEFVRRSRARTLPGSAQHQAYRVRRERLASLVSELSSAGHTVNWWREDHPAERQVAPYAADPSGNTVQLVASDDTSLLLDHVGVAVEDLDQAEVMYVNALGGRVAYYHGWTTEDVLDARQGADDDPCAPWTRRADVSFYTHVAMRNPVAQIFAGFGETYVAIAVTDARIAVPAEDVFRGTPRVVLDCTLSGDDLEAYLEEVRVSPVALNYDGGRVPFERQGRDFFLQDRNGNFLQLQTEDDR